MHWYTLTPFNQRTLQDTAAQDAEAFAARNHWDTDSSPLLNGHMIAAALRSLLPDAIITLRGPFLCRNNALYFPSPLNIKAAQFLVPIAWLPADVPGDADRLMLWDRRKPVPLVAIDQTPSGLNRELNCELNRELNHEPNTKTPDRHFLPYSVILQQLMPRCSKDSQVQSGLKDESGEQPWTIETRWHNPTKARCGNGQNQASIEQTVRLKPGWKWAIALDDKTDQKLKQLGEIWLIHLGEKQQPFWLEAQDEPFRQQWQTLQKQSDQNRKTAEQCLTQQPEAAKVIAYLVTPGVFERKYSGVATCRNFPWEWDLAYPGDRNQPPGPLVSLVTTHPVPIHCRCLSNAGSKDVLAVQISAVPPGSVYYLEYPAALFQDQPFLENGRPNKIHIWRQLGYSEFLWMPYQ